MTLIEMVLAGGDILPEVTPGQRLIFIIGCGN
jgi:hypothetical protein